MDYHSLNRRQLQALCKEHKIPANITNVAMANALEALLNNAMTPRKAVDSVSKSTFSTRVTRSQRKRQEETADDGKKCLYSSLGELSVKKEVSGEDDKKKIRATRVTDECIVRCEEIVDEGNAGNGEEISRAGECEGKVGEVEGDGNDEEIAGAVVSGEGVKGKDEEACEGECEGDGEGDVGAVVVEKGNYEEICEGEGVESKVCEGEEVECGEGNGEEICGAGEGVDDGKVGEGEADYGEGNDEVIGGVKGKDEEVCEGECDENQAVGGTVVVGNDEEISGGGGEDEDEGEVSDEGVNEEACEGEGEVSEGCGEGVNEGACEGECGENEAVRGVVVEVNDEDISGAGEGEGEGEVGEGEVECNEGNAEGEGEGEGGGEGVQVECNEGNGEGEGEGEGEAKKEKMKRNSKYGKENVLVNETIEMLEKLSLRQLKKIVKMKYAKKEALANNIAKNNSAHY